MLDRPVPGNCGKHWEFHHQSEYSMKQNFITMLRCAIFACLFAGIVAVPALCERHDSTRLLAKPQVAEVRDTAVHSLQIVPARDSLIAQKAVSETPNKNAKNQGIGWDGISIEVIVMGLIAVFTSLGWLYERYKKTDDAGRIRKAEIDAENEQKRFEEEEKERKEKEFLQSAEQKYLQHLREVLNKIEIVGFSGIDGTEIVI